MAVNVGETYKTEAASYEYQKKYVKAKTEAEEDKISEVAPEESAVAKVDTFEKTQTYKPDMDKVNEMKADLNSNISAFKQMVQSLFQRQSTYATNADSVLSKLLNIDKATQLKAQEAISEDGEWGVTKTADRILNFAKALSGGDPGKIELLKNAVIKGFEAAEKVWGGKMPDITQKTYDRIMEGFDAWENEGKEAPAPSEAADL